MTPILAPGQRVTLACSLWTTIALPEDTYIDVTFPGEFVPVRVHEKVPAFNGFPTLRMLKPDRCRVQIPSALEPDGFVTLGKLRFTLGHQAIPYTGLLPRIATKEVPESSISPIPSTNVPGAGFDNQVLLVHMGGIIVRVPTTLPCVRVVMEVEG